MTPREKAIELRNKMYLKIPAVYDPTNLPHYPIAKQCALIAVDEILQSNNLYNSIKTKFYLEVKQEIEKL
jgi:hypothetical protein